MRGIAPSLNLRPATALLVGSLVLLGVTACNREKPQNPADEPVVCSDALFGSFEEKAPTGDGQGHGPDIGSDEWKSVIEFKLGVRDKAGVPPRDTDAWCSYIDELVRHRASAGD